MHTMDCPPHLCGMLKMLAPSNLPCGLTSVWLLQDAYRRVTDLLEEVSTLRAQLSSQHSEAWNATHGAREEAERREREARLDLDRANQVVRKREIELEEVKRSLALSQHEVHSC